MLTPKEILKILADFILYISRLIHPKAFGFAEEVRTYLQNEKQEKTMFSTAVGEAHILRRIVAVVVHTKISAGHRGTVILCHAGGFAVVGKVCTMQVAKI